MASTKALPLVAPMPSIPLTKEEPWREGAKELECLVGGSALSLPAPAPAQALDSSASTVLGSSERGVREEVLPMEKMKSDEFVLITTNSLFRENLLLLENE